MDLISYFQIKMSSENKRPLSVTLIGILYVIAGTVGIIYHAPELVNITTQSDVSLIFALRLLAIIGGVFTLKGANWARWLLVVWIAYHVYISFFHETAGLIMHAALLMVTAVSLFHRQANAFFRP